MLGCRHTMVVTYHVRFSPLKSHNSREFSSQIEKIESHNASGQGGHILLGAPTHRVT